jgi:Domain of unknown function (DUF4965)/Domain of unknown function (DUF5127)/Domain of unknown function (DUF1793)/Domain of unknown function (DUF4964)
MPVRRNMGDFSGDRMRRRIPFHQFSYFCFAVAVVVSGSERYVFAGPGEPAAGRPPAVPLVACDPYFSVWSCADRLTDEATRHWTGKKQALSGMVRIDGKAFRLMGAEPSSVPALTQVGLRVLPTRTIYEFEGPETHVTLTFLTPSLPDDLDVLARPLTYLTWDVRSRDGRDHAVSLYFSASAELAVDSPDQRVTWGREPVPGLEVVRVGSEDQAVLRRKGDDLRIDWGFAYAAARRGEAIATVGSDRACSTAFVEGGKLPTGDDARMPRAVKDDLPVLAFVLDLGKVGAVTTSRHLMLAYDDLYSITYFRRNLRPYWRRDGSGVADLLRRAEDEYEGLVARSRAFDEEIMADLTRVGGVKYARLAALAYRQALAAHKLVADSAGKPLLFSKENFSNGCIATVDVIYPAAPIFLLFSPTLAKASLVPVLSYAASSRWKFPFAPHDLGTYPLANGQVYGGGERTEVDQMPVEETGNMLLLLAAVARQDGNADFAAPYWPQLKRWAAYLEEKGFDPENQLCTDDFAGHLAHNVNLSAKAILALGAYGILAEYRGEKAEGARHRALAKALASRWVEAGTEGDHTRLAFDRPGTWSQKYNLVWDRLLGLDLFPPEVIRKEVAFYLKTMDRYGLPLDNRRPYAKLDWTVWTATLADSRADFEALVNPLVDFLDESPTRVPMSDWYWTKDAKQAGFQARSVVGGVFIKLMADPTVWKKWAGRDRNRVSAWAPLPPPPTVRVVVPTARERPIAWRITTRRPAGDWASPGFDASSWTEANGGFGTPETPGTAGALRTEWKGPDIWLRREFSMPEGTFADLQLDCHHDEDAEIFLNGVVAARLTGYTSDYETTLIAPAARAALKPGKNILAIHCHQTRGGQYIDAGLIEVREAK